MALVTVKQKFQVVIPAKVRRQIGIRVGDLLDAKAERGKLVFFPKSPVDREIAEGLEDKRYIEANTNGIAAENEGGYIPQNEPLTDFQVDVNLRAIREVSDWKGWRPYRPVGLADATLLEHHECVKLWGGAGTSCSSNRIPWTRFLTLLEEEDMTFIAWATWKERPNNIPFRSYKLFVSPDGLSKRLVLDKPEHDALAGAGLRLRKMPLSDLKSFVGGPEPDVL